MFGNIAEPQLIWCIGSEVALDEIVMHWWPGLAGFAALLAERTPQPMLSTDPPHGPLSHRLTGGARLLDQVAVPELRGIAVGVEQRVGSIGLGGLGIGDGVGPPPVVGLAGGL